MRGRYAMSCGGPWLWGKSPRELGEAFLENCTRHSASMSGWIPPAWWAARALDFDALPQPARAAGSLFAAAGGAGLTLAFNPLRTITIRWPWWRCCGSKPGNQNAGPLPG